MSYQHLSCKLHVHNTIEQKKKSSEQNAQKWLLQFACHEISSRIAQRVPLLLLLAATAVFYDVCCEMKIFQWMKRGGSYNEFDCLACGLKHLHTEKNETLLPVV
uniref:Uncharacterized protein n=1 Tax=Anopheles atroparvus TaxID=41427 RepID=A0AAG5DQM2_ANOAO